MSIDLNAFIATVSQDRFGRYLNWADGDHEWAAIIYTLNTQLSEALYLPLQMLEIALRNRIHTVASSLLVGDPKLIWFDRPEFHRGSRQSEQIVRARHDVIKAGKIASPSQIIAATTFGYWTTFFGPEYEDLWQIGLHRVARTISGRGLKRKELSRPLFLLRKLRNRIAHHEPIIHWNLGHHHDKILKLIGYLSPIAAQWANQHSRFREVYPTERIRLHAEV